VLEIQRTRAVCSVSSGIDCNALELLVLEFIPLNPKPYPVTDHVTGRVD
jgi:hypothetical protein